MNKKEIIEVEFIGGLCNKLFDLFAICDISINDDIQIADPLFGWPNKNIYFSEIYDIEYFNNEMKKYNNGKEIIIPRNRFSDYKIINNDKYKLGEYSQKILGRQRENFKMENNCMNILVLKFLRLNAKYNSILEDHDNKIKTAIHLRVESDWRQYSTYKKVPPNEILLVNRNKLIKMYKNSNINSENIFFTTGENQEQIIKFFKKSNINSFYYYNKNYGYELNAAINFFLCVKADVFLGNTRSTFSNLVTLKRYIEGNDNSYIYNFKDSIFKREDKGLHCEAEKSIKKVEII